MSSKEKYVIKIRFYDYEHNNNYDKIFDNFDDAKKYMHHLDMVYKLQNNSNYSNSYWINWGHEELGWGWLEKYKFYKIIETEL
jgi:hypothetical protein